MPQASNLIFLAGAPSTDSLDWSENDLIHDLIPPYVPKGQASERASDDPQSNEADLPAWRRLDLVARADQGLPASNQNNQIRPWLSIDQVEEAPFLKTSDLSFDEGQSHDNGSVIAFSSAESEEILSQFYEHSFAIHEDIASSQIVPEEKSLLGAKPTEDVESFLTDNSLVTESTESSFLSSVAETPSKQKGAIYISLNGPVMDIKDVPSPVVLQRAFPQTITVNLVVGIISIEDPRNVRTRRGQDMEIVELLTGDETRAGFGVNFWLSAFQGQTFPGQAPNQSGLRESLSGLRRQDVVLIRNVALGSFRGKVYGQSLRRDQTKIEVLHRVPLDRSEKLRAPQLKQFYTDSMETCLIKAQRVADWVQRFVGPPLAQVGHGRQGRQLVEALPPDTQ